jgi:hypothetical protein
MKKSLFFGMFSMILPVSLQAQELVEGELQKVYVEPSQLAFANGGMFANFSGEWVALDAIYSDAGGILAAIKKNPNYDRWICVCRYNNNGWDRTCQRTYGHGEKCGLSRPW